MEKKFTKNDRCVVKIEDYGNDGEGIGRADGYTLFVKDAVVGDTVEAQITLPKKNYAFARTVKVIEPSPDRIDPPCPVCRQCGGCQIQTLSYEAQLRFKDKKVRGNLQRIGGFSPEILDKVMEPIIGMDDPWRYRNKAQYPIGTSRDGKPVAGFYAGRTHDIIAEDDCLIGTAENKSILEVILAHMTAHGIAPYDEVTHKGLIRHVLIRKGFTSGGIMVCIIINKKIKAVVGETAAEDTAGSENDKCISESDKCTSEAEHAAREYIPAQSELISAITAAVPAVKSISLNSNTENTNVILGSRTVTIYGEDTITDTIHVLDSADDFKETGEGVTFRISPQSFYQVNPVQTEKLYSTALEYAGLTGNETVWDLYCGIGTISLFLARHAKKVCGVEIVPQAIDDARRNAVENGITNAEFFLGKAEEVLPKFYEENMSGVVTGIACKDGMQNSMDGACADRSNAAEKDTDISIQIKNDMIHPDVIVVDPPRKGCDIICLDTMLKMKPDRIVYVSCDSATLARDLKILTDGGYELERVRPCDQFPMTVHIETAVLLSRVSNESRMDRASRHKST